MLQNISPYALLCMSKPKKEIAMPTPYDLFSQAAQENPASPPEPASAALPALEQDAQNPPEIPVRRTHYISDIHARHGAAMSRTSQISRPL